VGGVQWSPMDKIKDERHKRVVIIGEFDSGKEVPFFQLNLHTALWKSLDDGEEGHKLLRHMRTFLTLVVILSACSVQAKVFDVRIYGAKGDSVTMDTAAIQKALDECGEAGGGTVRFPAGIYLSQPIVLRSATTLELDTGATLLAATNQADFMKMPGNWTKAKGSNFIPFISGRDLKDVTFTGGGTIDGSGLVWWGEAEKARQRVPGYTLPRPNLIVLQDCQNVRMENITLRNSPKYHFVPEDCEGVVVSNVTILAPEHAANTDGIDPGDCKDVLITRCRIDTGDDNVAIKAGRKVPGREFGSEDIVVTDCTFLHGHGMSIGSETLGGVPNVTVENCVFDGTDNGIRIKSQRGKGGLVQNIVYKDITMTNVDPAVTFTCYYMANSAKDPMQKVAPKNDSAQAVMAGTPAFRDIYVSNLTATCQRGAGMIVGLPESRILNVVFQNVNISAIDGMKIENAANIQAKDLHITVAEGEPFILKNAQVDK
jgi:polygalacturonase